MADKNVKLKASNGDYIFPKTKWSLIEDKPSDIGNVKKVNNQSPDANGNITVTASNITQTAVSGAANINAALVVLDNVANGKNTAHVCTNLINDAPLDSYYILTHSTSLKIGDVILITELDKPDLWVCACNVTVTTSGAGDFTYDDGQGYVVYGTIATNESDFSNDITTEVLAVQIGSTGRYNIVSRLETTKVTVPQASAQNPGAVSSSSSIGSSTAYAKADHVHNIVVGQGDSNGQVKIAGQNASVKGLGSAAYTASNTYATASQGTKADAAQPKTLSSVIVEGQTTVEGTLNAIATNTIYWEEVT